MKIIYMAPIRLPTEKAHGIQIMETCAALFRAGAEVELIVTDRKTPISEDAFEYYSIKEKFQITRIHAPDTIELGPIGFLFHVLFFTVRAARYVTREAHADIVYTRDPTTLLLCGLLGLRPLAWEVHTAHPRIPRVIVRLVSALIPITRGLADWYISRGIPKEKIHVAPDAADVRAFVSIRGEDAALQRQRLGLPSQGKIALYLGSFGLYDWKGIDVAKAAAEHAPEITWLFIGGAERECTNFMRGSPKNVIALPRVRRSDVPRTIAAADVLLLPNKSGDPASERDTSPMKLFEYMASGRPILASDVASLREVLDERNAFLVPPNDAKALAKADISIATYNAKQPAVEIARFRLPTPDLYQAAEIIRQN